MTSGLVTPNSVFFLELCETQSQAKVAEKLGFSIGLLRKCQLGLKVRSSRMKQAADRLSCSVSKLIAPDKETQLPNDPAYYEAMKYGAYIDNDRRRAGAPLWFSESLSLNRAKGAGISGKDLCFTGRIVNRLGQAFTITARRQNENYFSLAARSEGMERPWQACFTIRKDDVLCGTWSGSPDHVTSNVAIYRYFWSRQELSLKDLKQLTKETSIECFFEADALG